MAPEPFLTQATLTGSYVNQMLIQQLILARNLLAGIRADENPDHLHDFRVALRRVRAFLSIVKGIYTQPLLNQLKHRVQGLAQATNTLRDLDVWRLEAPTHISVLPLPLHPGFHALTDYLHEKRQHAYRQCTIDLEPATDILNQLISRLGTLESEAWDKISTKPALPTARKCFRKQQVKILQRCRELTEITSDSDIHKLRIECKKLRYSLDLFAPLCDKKQLKQINKKLKNMQDALGNFNDLSVQQTFLQQLSGELISPAQPADDYPLLYRQELLSCGALMGALHTQQQYIRKDILAQTNPFCRALSACKGHQLYPA